MKLCIVSPMPPAHLGLGNYLVALLPFLAGNPAADEVVIPADSSARTSNAHKNIRIERAWDVGSPAALQQIIAAVRREQPDLVWHNVGLVLGSNLAANAGRLAAPALCRQLGFPTVVTLHNLLEAEPIARLGAPDSPLYRTAGRFATRMLLRADHVCLLLRRFVEIAQVRYGARNVSYMPHHVFGIPVCENRKDKCASNVLAFGLMAPYKGLDVLLKAHQLLASSDPFVRLRIAGGTHPRFPLMRPGISQPGVEWLGYVSDEQVEQLMQWADILAVPSLAATGASSVIHRAVARGCSIVASNLTDFQALANEQGFGIEFVTPGDPMALAQGLQKIRGDSKLRESRVEANLHAARQFTPEIIADRYVHLFKQVLVRAPAAEAELRLTPGQEPRRLPLAS